jgi:heme/copper-type cytochrome/quinol oxidase subunit 2
MRPVDAVYVIADILWIVYFIVLVPTLVLSWMKYRFRKEVQTWEGDWAEEKSIEDWWVEKRSRVPIWVVKVVETVLRYSLDELEKDPQCCTDSDW